MYILLSIGGWHIDVGRLIYFFARQEIIDKDTNMCSICRGS